MKGADHVIEYAPKVCIYDADSCYEYRNMQMWVIGVSIFVLPGQAFTLSRQLEIKGGSLINLALCPDIFTI